MTIYGATSAQRAAWDGKDRSGAPTIGWFLRRSALWAAMVGVGIVLACALYAVVTNAEVANSKTNAAPATQTTPLGV